MRRFSILATASGLLLGSLAAIPATSQQLQEDKAGLKVGAKAPDFKLKDQSGQERSLEAFVKKGKVALVFYRSASW